MGGMSVTGGVMEGWRESQKEEDIRKSGENRWVGIKKYKSIKKEEWRKMSRIRRGKERTSRHKEQEDENFLESNRRL